MKKIKKIVLWTIQIIALIISVADLIILASIAELESVSPTDTGNVIVIFVIFICMLFILNRFLFAFLFEGLTIREIFE